MAQKSIKLRKELYDRLVLVDKSPTKAIEQLLGPRTIPVQTFQLTEKEVQGLKKRLDKLEDWLHANSGGTF